MVNVHSYMRGDFCQSDAFALANRMREEVAGACHISDACLVLQCSGMSDVEACAVLVGIHLNEALDL